MLVIVEFCSGSPNEKLDYSHIFRISLPQDDRINAIISISANSFDSIPVGLWRGCVENENSVF